MRLATVTESSNTRIGVLKDDGVIDLSRAAPELPTDMIGLLSAGPAAMQTARAAAEGEIHYAADAIRLESPILRPGKILAIGLNYRAHAQESGMALPEVPLVFTKQATSINGPYDPVHWSEESKRLDYEGELAIVIGKRCRRVPVDKAANVIAGYCVANDVSVRDWQMRGAPPQFTMGKSWDTHCPLGPAIVTADEVDPHTLQLRTYVNDELRQDTNTNDLIFNCYELVAFLSTAFTLEPGDVIVTGTPSGVGMAMQPPQALVVGDRVRVEIDGLGAIENEIIAEPENTARY
jgi:2-keto-4-pentenoate hydratase/2-oxohepta-3-ene-1,7-dioic acid hydratase in catechol pathway